MDAVADRPKPYGSLRSENTLRRADNLELLGQYEAAAALRNHVAEREADAERRRAVFKRVGSVPAVVLSPTRVGPAPPRRLLGSGRPGTRRVVSRSAGGGSSGSDGPGEPEPAERGRAPDDLDGPER